jgi:hypothetical protein
MLVHEHQTQSARGRCERKPLPASDHYFNPFQPALLGKPKNEVWERLDVTPAGRDRASAGSTALNWHGLLLEGWQSIDDTMP